MQFRLEVIITETNIRHKTRCIPEFSVRKAYPLHGPGITRRTIPLLGTIHDDCDISFRKINKGDYVHTVPGVIKLMHGPLKCKSPIRDRHELKYRCFGRVVMSIREKSIRTRR